ncbi:unnamed protein product [Rotaria socialis]|uniref:Uncharacterized protein n=2 Tax=Rotaria socialis TaxID=392032 RepID=A0A820N9R3_9BILA|nr:unnamed protein product [Rotaria socialis]CAF3344319.1 unnamed protein product [Rotaria socialis]CAF3748158.1 unnamed protein product [Rotaria socialis]CAF4385739.1 unnamed protein product [Rotaria socialis]
MASVAAAAAIRRIPPPRIYVSTIAASINRRRSTTETKQPTVYENDQDHEKCFIQENELRELNRRHLIRIELLENDYRQLDDDMAQLQHEHNALLKQKRMLEEELERSSYHATSNVDLHVYTQRLENECRDLRSQITLREKEKFELNEMIADLEVQMKQARERQEEWRDAYNELENTLAIETETRQCLEVKLKEANIHQKENENQIHRLKADFDELILTKQEVLKANYILVQNAESLREQLRTVRTQAAEIRIVSASLSTSFDNLDESLPCLIYDNDNDDTPDCENMNNQSGNGQSSLFSEINSLETMSNETITKCLDGTQQDIELDLLLAKTTAVSSSLTLINQLINEVKCLHRVLLEQENYDCVVNQEHDRLENMKILLKRVLDNTQVFDTRFRKLQLLLIASREQQQCHQAELDDFFRLVDKRLLSESEESSNQQHRLVSILEAYEHELNRLRQTTRTNDDTIRSYERRLAEQQSMASNWRMKNTFLEKNQRKLIDKIKELNSERRQLIESSAQKRTRRRAQPTNQIEQKQEKPPVILPPPSQPEIRTYHLTRSRSLPSLKSSNNGRQSRNDSGVVLNDEIFNHQSQSIIHNRRRIKTNTINQLVMHTSNHVCIQKNINSSTISNSKYLTHTSCRFHWLFHIFFLFIISLLFSFIKLFPLDK